MSNQNLFEEVELESRLAQTQLLRDIKNGLFTPFLGAGASSLRPKFANLDRFPWQNVAETLTAIRDQLDDDERSVTYLRSFARQRLMSANDVDKYIPVKDVPEVKEVLRGHALVHLQVALVKATMRLTCYFGETFAAATPSVSRIREVSVPFESENEDALEAVKSLFDGVDCTQTLRNANQESPFIYDRPGLTRQLRTQRIQEKLLILILRLIPRNLEVFEERFKKHALTVEGLPRVFREVKESDRCLRLDAVQWLSELIWHTLRYWVPRYPTTAELAFELSLGVKEGAARRAELAQAAEALSFTKELDREIQSLMRYCEVVGQDRREHLDREAAAFFLAIAAAAQHQYDLYCEGGKVRDPRSKFDSHHNGRDQYQRFLPPIVFSTNFDQALENVFRESNLPYHVLFPVKSGHYKGQGDAEGKSIWIVRTYFSVEEGRQPKDLEWEDFCGPDPKQNLLGPLMVKLHGSPLEPLPEHVDQHWLVLSEEGYLQALSETYSLPEWLGTQLHTSDGGSQHRSMWFLGYSLSDWNVRLQLYQHSLQAPKVQGYRSTVDRDDDFYRRAFLGNLNVRQWKGDLGRLPKMIDRVLDDDEISTSPKVNALVDKLEKVLGS